MMKKLLILCCLLAAYFLPFAQPFSPDPSTAVCPGTVMTYTFTNAIGEDISLQSSTGFTSLTTGINSQDQFYFTAITPDGPASVVLYNSATSTAYPAYNFNISTLKGVTPKFASPPARRHRFLRRRAQNSAMQHREL